MKTIFITGASTGLGKAAAQLFASKGWTVIATMRTPDAAQDLKTISNITLLPLDVTRIDQIEEAVKSATAKHKIDVVLNNAGYGLMGPLESTDDAQITRQIDTNLLGVLRVTKAFPRIFVKMVAACLSMSHPSAAVQRFHSLQSITLPSGRSKASAKAWHSSSRRSIFA